MRAALIRANRVVNVVVVGTDEFSPPEGVERVDLGDDSPVAPGWTRTGPTTFDPPPPAPPEHWDAIAAKAAGALEANATYLAIGAPTNAQIAAQVNRLTRECSALIRLLLRMTDTDAGT